MGSIRGHWRPTWPVCIRAMLLYLQLAAVGMSIGFGSIVAGISLSYLRIWR
jgi:hypothetical protein